MTTDVTTDVVVVGAGPSGTAAAIELARQNVSVTVIDKATFPRDKICGDGLTTGALRTLEELGLTPAHFPNWQPVSDILVRSPSGRTVELPLPRGRGQYLAVLPRRDLDAALVVLAREAGADVHEGTSFSCARGTADHFTLTIDDGSTIRARYAIGADGMWSPLRKTLGLNTPGYLGEIHAFRQYFSSVSDPADRKLIVWFEPDLLPGYVWSFPLPGGRANVGFGVRRGGHIATRDMKALWPDLLSRPHIAAWLGPNATPDEPHRAWPLPARINKTCLTGPRVLFVGDAAAAIDPMTGEGIGQALLTGRLAAQALLSEGVDDPVAAARSYRKATRAALLADHHMSARLSKVLAHERGARGALRAAALTPWTRRNFARWMFEDYPRAMILTPRRWHRGMFTGPGAFREQ